MNASFQNMWSIWLSGGWVMVPLVILACMLYYMAIQLLLYTYRSGPQATKASNWKAWVADPTLGEGASGQIIAYTQRMLHR